MTLDENSPAWEHARLIDHERRPAVNYVDEKDLALITLAEDIAITRDHLADLEAKYRAISTWTPPHQDAEPGDRGRAGVDIRMFDVDGDETREQWTEPEPQPRSVVDVSTGGRV